MSPGEAHASNTPDGNLPPGVSLALTALLACNKVSAPWIWQYRWMQRWLLYGLNSLAMVQPVRQEKPSQWEVTGNQSLSSWPVPGRDLWSPGKVGESLFPSQEGVSSSPQLPFWECSPSSSAAIAGWLNPREKLHLGSLPATQWCTAQACMYSIQALLHPSASSTENTAWLIPYHTHYT